MPYGQISCNSLLIGRWGAMDVWRRLLLAVVCGVAVASVYAAQPVLEPMGRDLGVPPELTGWIVATGQFGYLVGLVLLVPLGDVVDRRRLIAVHLAITAVGMILDGLGVGGMDGVRGARGGWGVRGRGADHGGLRRVSLAACRTRTEHRRRDLGRCRRHPGRAGRHRHARRGVGLAKRLRRARGAVTRARGPRPRHTAVRGAPQPTCGVQAGRRLTRRTVRAAPLPDARAHRVLLVRIVRNSVERTVPAAGGRAVAAEREPDRTVRPCRDSPAHSARHARDDGRMQDGLYRSAVSRSSCSSSRGQRSRSCRGHCGSSSSASWSSTSQSRPCM